MPRGRGGARHRGAGKQDLRHAGLGVRDASPPIVAPTIKDITFWLRKNGANVSDSATSQSSTNVDEREVASFSQVIELQAGDYVELMFLVNDLNLILNAIAATGSIPRTSSVTLSVTQL